MNRKQTFSILVLVLFIASAFGVAFDYLSPGSRGLKYNGHTFHQADQQYAVTVSDKELRFYYYPADLEYLTLDPQVTTLLDPPIYIITYDPQNEEAEAFAQLQFEFEQYLQNTKAISRALTNNTGTDLPQKTCADALPTQPVILLQQSNQSSITAQNNCIIINSTNPADLLSQGERIIYKLLGIMT